MDPCDLKPPIVYALQLVHLHGHFFLLHHLWPIQLPTWVFWCANSMLSHAVIPDILNSKCYLLTTTIGLPLPSEPVGHQCAWVGPVLWCSHCVNVGLNAISGITTVCIIWYKRPACHPPVQWAGPYRGWWCSTLDGFFGYNFWSNRDISVCFVSLHEIIHSFVLHEIRHWLLILTLLHYYDIDIDIDNMMVLSENMKMLKILSSSGVTPGCIIWCSLHPTSNAT